MTARYSDFVLAKRRRLQPEGLTDLPPLHPALFPFQRAAVEWALRQGRCALFEAFGLGKTLQQLVWANALAEADGVNTLILTPLAVAFQTCREADTFGIEAVYCKEEVDAITALQRGAHIIVTNYDRLDRFDLSRYRAVVLDESAILRGFTTKIRQSLTAKFRDFPYRLACTACPAPNDLMEIGNHAEFLGIMPANEMLARWFINDASKAGNYRLKGHAARDFWEWLASWAVTVRTPADLGYDDTGYVLPALHLHKHIVDVDATDFANGELFKVGALSATKIHGEMRLTCAARATRVAEVIAMEPDEPWLIWCNTNYEADALAEAVPDIVEIRGSDTSFQKEQRLIGFTTGEIKRLVTKPEIAGHGLNFQHCARAIYIGLSYSMEQFEQSRHRIYRFGQKREVHCHICLASTEAEVFNTVFRKKEQFEAMREEMVAASRRAHGRDPARVLKVDLGSLPVDIPRWLETKDLLCQP